MNWALLLQVLVSALVAAVGAVGLFALGVRGWSDHVDARARGESKPLGVVLAAASFALCAGIVGYGLWIIVAG